MVNAAQIYSNPSAQGYAAIASTRSTLKSIDNGGTDGNPVADAVQLNYDDTVVTACFKGNDYTSRSETKGNVDLQDYQETTAGNEVKYIYTSVARSAAGAYDGWRMSGTSTGSERPASEHLSNDDSAFIYNAKAGVLTPIQTPAENNREVKDKCEALAGKIASYYADAIKAANLRNLQSRWD